MPIPIVYGTHTIGGNIISLFTQAEGEDNYLYMLLALCEGEIDGIVKNSDNTAVCTTSDSSAGAYAIPEIKLDDQLISNYSDIEWWYRKGTNTTDGTKNQFDPTAQNVIPYFDWGSKFQYTDGRDVDEDGIIKGLEYRNLFGGCFSWCYIVKTIRIAKSGYPVKIYCGDDGIRK